MGNLNEYKIKGIGEGVCAVCGKPSIDPVHGVGVPSSNAYTSAPLDEAMRRNVEAPRSRIEARLRDEAIRKSFAGGQTYADTDSMHTDQEVVIIDRTPNVGITNPNIRLWIGVALFMLSLISAIAAITLSNFPELEIGNAVVSRAIVTINQIISLLTGAFGLAFVSPNVPTKP